MNGKERILTAVAHKEPDRVPMDFGGSMVTSIHKIAYDKLKKHLNILGDKKTEIARGRSLVAKVDAEVQDSLGIDTRMLIANSPDGWASEMPAGDNRLIDEWGIEWHLPDGFSNYEIANSPLWGKVSPNDIKTYKWPDPYNIPGLKGLRKNAEALREATDKAIIANLALQIHTQSYFLRGFSDYLMDLVIQPSLVEAIMDGVLDVFVERAKIIMNEIGDLVDIVYVADDLGTQTGPLFSPEIYRKILKPRQMKLFEAIKNKNEVKILYHSCGSVVKFIDDFVDVGVDILNPVQVTAKGMNTEDLKKKFGHKICFWGGIDTQHVLPFGTPEEVREEVKKRIDDLAASGGYVVAPVHNIRPEVPPENIIAMVEAVREFGKY